MKILIVGVDSTIGQALFLRFRHAGYSVFGTTRRVMDDDPALFFLDLLNFSLTTFRMFFDVVYLCAGVTKIAMCEASPATSYQINVDAQLSIALHFLKQGSHVIYLSSNAVFDGKKPRYHITDHPCPVSEYGKQKALVEKKLMALKEKVTIVRLTKVLTRDYPLIRAWCYQLKENMKIKVRDDLMLAPLSLDTIVKYLRVIGEKTITGLIHFSGEKDVRYTDIAMYLTQHIQVSRVLIEPWIVMDTLEPPIFASLDISETLKVFKHLDLSFEAVMSELYGDLEISTLKI